MKNKNLLRKLTNLTYREAMAEMSAIISEKPIILDDDATPDDIFEAHISYAPSKAHGRTREYRINKRLEEGRAIKPCGRECHAWGDVIIRTTNHTSMVNSKELVNDMEYLIHAAEIAPNPGRCTNYFYIYVNKFLKRNSEFKLNFLKALYKNVNVLTRSSIEYFVQTFGFEEENEILTNDEEFKKELIEHFKDIYEPEIAFIDEKQLTRHEKNKIAKEASLRLQDLLTIFDKNIEEEINEDEIDIRDLLFNY